MSVIPQVGLDDEAQRIYERVAGSAFGVEQAAAGPDDPAHDPGYWDSLNKEAERRWGPYVGETKSAETKAFLANLPEEFWSSREVLAKIRQGAHSAGRSADAVFGAVMARTAAMTHHDLKFDFGLGEGSLNLYAALIGKSGVGKSKAADEAYRLIHLPTYLDNSALGNFRDRIGLGTGEGIPEAYMGWVERETGELKRNGDPKTEKVRDQVRHNVFFYVDEGESLTRTIERTGTTIGPALRTAWLGATLGQSNAREETTRQIPAGSYSMGLVIGYQYDTAQPLLADVGPGTPQRFLWMSATDPTVPARPPERPATFRLPLCNGKGRPATGVIGCDETIRIELWERNLARVHGEEEDDEHDSHIVLMRAKVACLLAVLDGRMHVNADDWELARVVYETSSAVRNSLIAYGKEKAAKDQEQKVKAHVEREERAQLARAGVPAKVERIARWLALKVHEQGGGTRSVIRKSAAGRDKPFFEAAEEYADSQGWIVHDDTGRMLLPGKAVPA